MLKLVWILAVMFVQDSNWNVNKKGVVADGYDVVSYFSGEPKEGNELFASTYDGATFYFHSMANKKTFDENPSKYTPEFGGWCAYAIADTGEKVEVNPETYTITDGKLYLFYNRFGTNTLKYWQKDEANFIKKSQITWQTKYQH